jgi:hypothetical protein
MSKRASNFRTDIKRAAQALRSAGIPIGRIELERGKVTFYPQTAEDKYEATAEPENLKDLL